MDAGEPQPSFSYSFGRNPTGKKESIWLENMKKKGRERKRKEKKKNLGNTKGRNEVFFS